MVGIDKKGGHCLLDTYLNLSESNINLFIVQVFEISS